MKIYRHSNCHGVFDTSYRSTILGHEEVADCGSSIQYSEHPEDSLLLDSSIGYDTDQFTYAEERSGIVNAQPQTFEVINALSSNNMYESLQKLDVVTMGKFTVNENQKILVKIVEIVFRIQRADTARTT